MKPAWPRYLLFADAIRSTEGETGWRFVLSAIDSPHSTSAEHFESQVQRRERLELMAAVRGLEALDQPSLVTLICPGVYVRHGISRGLSDWRDGNWKWECFGRRVWVRDHDLWRRID
ncbi:MAG: RNase H family protein, partial [Planctomycetota bacterium]